NVPETCEADKAEQYMPPAGANAGLIYDAQCAGKAVAYYESLSACQGYQETNACCRLYVGTKGAGAACDDFGDTDECAQGLRCEGGVCTALCGSGTAQLGQSCETAECAEGLWCDYYSSDTPVCSRLPGAGESCYDSFECEGDLRCVAVGDDDVCVVPGKLGDACQEFTCGKGLGCFDGVCGKAKAAGNLCTSNDQCDSGACEEVCQKPTAQACVYFY
ncbi:MAG: hypothetical protein KC766_15095, partial [Myxococcales bacterium]|nr:hypothetical protein [Myxococcales bacterium]